jgi:hypothetical protein
LEANNNNRIKEGQRVLENLSHQSKNDESEIKEEYNPNKKF